MRIDQTNDLTAVGARNWFLAAITIACFQVLPVIAHAAVEVSSFRWAGSVAPNTRIEIENTLGDIRLRH
jgi:hypothetical protein